MKVELTGDNGFKWVIQSYEQFARPEETRAYCLIYHSHVGWETATGKSVHPGYVRPDEHLCYERHDVSQEPMEIFFQCGQCSVVVPNDIVGYSKIVAWAAER